MSELWPRYLELGDSAITVALGEGISRKLSREVADLTRALAASNIEGILDIVPAYASLTVYFDPRRVAFDELTTSLRSAVAHSRAGTSSVATDDTQGKTIRIPTRYDGEDLADVAARTGLSRDRIVELHSSREYRVYVIGFVPGFAYLGELDEALVLPRRATPRKRVPAGSVAIAEAQTGIYPFSTPGGWHLLGTTRVTMFDVAAPEPALLRVGDTVIFEPID
ncbi:MAG TPA: 5-oxoprolinase subunit PxpB [Gemmatimonadaceae bacterium]|nr:5-oxoprolinase subunit PxpB [Gemmatimonadaceae bacterium]